MNNGLSEINLFEVKFFNITNPAALPIFNVKLILPKLKKKEISSRKMLSAFYDSTKTERTSG